MGGISNVGCRISITIAGFPSADIVTAICAEPRSGDCAPSPRARICSCQRFCCFLYSLRRANKYTIIVTSPAPATDAPSPMPTTVPVPRRLDLWALSPSFPHPLELEDPVPETVLVLGVGFKSARAVNDPVGRCMPVVESALKAVSESPGESARVRVDGSVEGGLVEGVGVVLLSELAIFDVVVLVFDGLVLDDFVDCTVLEDAVVDEGEVAEVDVVEVEVVEVDVVEVDVVEVDVAVVDVDEDVVDVNAAGCGGSGDDDDGVTALEAELEEDVLVEATVWLRIGSKGEGTEASTKRSLGLLQQCAFLSV